METSSPRLDLSQPGVSKHLKVLREAGLVALALGRQAARYTPCASQPLAEVDAWLEPYRPPTGRTGSMAPLSRHLEENP